MSLERSSGIAGGPTVIRSATSRVFGRSFGSAWTSRLIISVKCSALAPSIVMLAAQHYSDLLADTALPKYELLEIHRSKISLHHAKAGYSYPTIRLPHTFLTLAGLQTSIYQTVHDGALAFLVVISPSSQGLEESAQKSENAKTSAKASVFTRPA
jgi:hypothetical protein